MLRRAEEIVIVRDARVLNANVRYCKSGKIVCTYTERVIVVIPGRPPYGMSAPEAEERDRKCVYSVKRRDEGTTWARGWDTTAANALRTVVALRGELGSSIWFG